ncbi:hypothetical protein [Fortiea contorta]|uniref:WD40 domain-containing protein n=1 Tax=Fortiea contorta TaxID=1892405 RepID=UPI00034CCD50|nr:hypothetical protein [Fortiea contorta]
MTNEQSVQQLAWAIAAAQGQFKLILARCNYASLCDRLIERLQAISQVEISVLRLGASRRTLYTVIREEFGEELPACLMVLGWESVENLAQMLTSANQVREEFRQHFPFPLVLWINDEVYKQIMQLAPDLESWAITKSFPISQAELINLISETANQWFGDSFQLSFDKYLHLETELTAAQQDLIGDHEESSLVVQADLASLLGFSKQIHQKLDAALEHYQQAWQFWQQINRRERAGKILGEMSFCYYLKAVNQADVHHPDWQVTKHYVQEYIKFLVEAENPTLIANSIYRFGEVLAKLQQWIDLKNFAEQALAIHQAQSQPRELARDYGYLAEAALAQANWTEASQFANQAIEFFSTIPSPELENQGGFLAELPAKILNSRDQSLYQFLLGRAQYHLGQISAAIHSLETAVQVGNPQGDVKFYLEILGFLQQLYFQQKQYLQAYKIKQQQRSIEQQFRLRAFVGAGRLQARKQTLLETLDVEARNFASLLQDNIATEIAASGRQLDIERLTQRIGEPSYKLIVICGQSGVGKSSLVNGGLVPALKNKAIGIQDNLPIVMSVYSNWEGELGRLLGVVLGDEGDERDGEVGRWGGGEVGRWGGGEVGRWGDGEMGGVGIKGSGFEAQVSGSEAQVSASKAQVSASKAQVSGSKAQVSGSKAQVSGSKAQVSGSKAQVSGSKAQVSGFEAQVSGSKAQVSGSEAQASGSEAQASGSEAQVSGSEAQGSGFEAQRSAYLLLQLRENEQRNLRTVLIFDQFEEFFFVYPEPAQRRRFFEFLGECFHVLSVKVILSLRVDYIHYLLECNRLPSMKIIGNDILSSHVLYQLGNFSTADAKSIIQRLTEQTSFRLEPALIDQLVEDLAAELGEVRPIELQVVGAQLQTENITTQAQYLSCGTKQELVKRYLAEVVEDCGEENQQAAEILLYLLTDEKGTRPLKTRTELERDLQQYILVGDVTTAKTNPTSLLQRGNVLFTTLRKKSPQTQESADKDNQVFPISNIDLIVEIFVKSGLVILLPETPADRYQLIHDYLAAFIRQQQEPKLKQVMAELEKERKQRKISETKLNRFLKRALFGSVVAGVVLAGLAGVSVRFAFVAEEEKQNSLSDKINNLNDSSETFFASEKHPNALITALKAGIKLKSASLPSKRSDTQMQTVATLQQAVYLKPKEKPENRAIEVNTLQGHSNAVISVNFSPSGQQLVSGSYDNTIKLWDVATGKPLKTLSGHKDTIISVSFSPSGRQLASGSRDNTIKLWDVTRGKLLKTLYGHSDAVYSVSFSPDGRQLVSGSRDKTIKLWDVATGKLLPTLQGHRDTIISVSFSPDGRQLVSGSRDKTIKLWDIATGKLLKTWTGHSDVVSSVSFSPDGRQLVSGSGDNTIKLWDVSTGKLIKTWTGHSDAVNSVGFSPSGQQLVSGSDDNTIKLWDVSTGKLLKTLTEHSDAVNSVKFSLSGRQLVSGSGDKTIKLWDVSTGKLLKTFSGHSSAVISVNFSSSGKELVSGGGNNTIKLWDVTTGKLLKTFSGHSDAVYSVSFSPSGQQLVSGSGDNTIKLWDVTTGKLLKTFSGHSDTIYSVSFSLSGKELVSGSADKTIKLWDVASGKLLKTFSGHSDAVYSVSFSPSGKELVSGSDDNTIKLWDVTTGKLLQTFSGHSSWVLSVGFSPSGEQLVSGSGDKTIKLWDVTSGKLLKTFSGHSRGVRSVNFSSSGKELVSGSADKTIIVWDLNLDDLLRSGCELLKNYLTAHPEVREELRECGR